ncbi:MAG: ABC transporter substrate-binding protein [Spirochaetales bacterium]
MKKLLTVAMILLIASSLVFARGNKEADNTVKMFQVKVEIKDALDAYAADYSARTGTTITVETLGGGGDYSGALKAKAQAGEMPDIFGFDGDGAYALWKDYMYDLSNESWVSDTDLAYMADGKVYGFPVAIEGFGLAYNVEILEKAGVDPASLTTREAYEAAFKKIDAQKAELGLDAVVAIATSVSGGMWWDAAQHNLSAYWGGGLDYGDTSVMDAALEGYFDRERFTEYAKYLQLLFTYADRNILVNGSYDNQVGSFAQEKTAFIHQGNWIDPNLNQLGVTFDIGYAPNAFTSEEQEGLLVFAPSFYAVNKNSPHVDEALAFLEEMATTQAGHEYMVTEAGMIPAFKSVTLEPTGQLSQAISEANQRGGNYSVLFGMLPEGYGMNVIAPIFDLFAQDPTQIDRFIADMERAINGMAGL